MFYELLIGEETFHIFFGSPGADQIPVDGVQLIVSGDDEQISPSEWHFGLADGHVFDIDGWAIHLLLENSFFLALLGFVGVSFEVIGDHVDGWGLYPLLVLFDSPDLEVFVAVVEVGHKDVVLVVDQVDGHVEGGAVFECVVVDFACPAVYDV